jgi:pimeloyl-ACP methyl ester carboxylesterase
LGWANRPSVVAVASGFASQTHEQDHRMPLVETNGIELYYEMQGDAGPPLVLLAGLGYPAWQWGKMAPLLAKRCRVILPDNRGVGKSAKPPGPYTADLLAADTLGLLDALGIAQAVVMGHSMGGFIAQALALGYPQRVSKLILASTNFGGPHHAPITPAAMAVLTDMSSDPVTRFRNGLAVSTAPGFVDAQPALIEEWLAWRAANPIDPAGYQAQLAIGLGLLRKEASFEQRLPSLAMPTLILSGAHDAVVPPANVELLAAQIPHSRVHLLPDAGHFFPLETPEEAAQVVIDFIEAF